MEVSLPDTHGLAVAADDLHPDVLLNDFCFITWTEQHDRAGGGDVVFT